jgi:hypothetical protein
MIVGVEIDMQLLPYMSLTLVDHNMYSLQPCVTKTTIDLLPAL